MKKTITLGSLHELLDGVVETPGRIIIIITNYPKALIRPGRIDMNIQFSKTSKQDISEMFKLWFNRTLTVDELFIMTLKDFHTLKYVKYFSIT